MNGRQAAWLMYAFAVGGCAGVMGFLYLTGQLR